MRKIRVGGSLQPSIGSGSPNILLSESEYQRVRALVKNGGRGEENLDDQVKLLKYVRENGTTFCDRILGVECEEALGKILSKGASGFSRTSPITISRDTEKGEAWTNKILNDTSALDSFRETWSKEADAELERWSSHKFTLPPLSSIQKLPIQSTTTQKISMQQQQQQRQPPQTMQTTQQKPSNCRRLLNPSAKRNGKFDPASSLLKPYIRYDDEDEKDCNDDYGNDNDDSSSLYSKTDFMSASTKRALDEAKKGRQQPQQQQQPQRSSSSFTKTNKTLGMKRKFVPPLKKDPESNNEQLSNVNNDSSSNNTNTSHKSQPPKKYLFFNSHSSYVYLLLLLIWIWI